jgi:phage shock protein PspC (stress-responsive transcriptional regulator)
MKKTLTINLSGSVFHIDDDAYEKLHEYLNKINRRFGNDKDAKEIVEDIESRIAELFTSKLKDGDEVINISHVDEVITIMGTPEAISNEEEEAQEKEKEKEKTSDKKYYRMKGRRLYRDPEDKVLGGVCSGLGAYFNMDPVIIRILFVVAFFLPVGSSALIYIILWIVVPKALSTAQRLEMKGEVVNIDNISKTIKEEMQDVKENFRNYRSNPMYTQGRSGIQEVGNVFVSVLKVLGTILLVIIGIPFIFVGVVLLIVLFSLLFASHGILGLTPFDGLDHLSLFFSQGSTMTWIWIGLLIVISIPLIMLVYAGIKMIFHIKTPNHIFGPIIGGVFVIGILILLFNGSITLGEFNKSATVITNENVVSSKDTLYLTAKHGSAEGELEAFTDPDINFGRFRLGTLNGKEILIGVPDLKIEACHGSAFDLVINKVSRGLNSNSARKNAEEILFNYQVKDSLMNVQPSFVLPRAWRNQRVNLKLTVPVGKTIFLDESLKPIIHDIKNTSDTYDDDMLNKYWTMKTDGLTLVNRAVPNVKPAKK